VSTSPGTPVDVVCAHRARALFSLSQSENVFPADLLNCLFDKLASFIIALYLTVADECLLFRLIKHVVSLYDLMKTEHLRGTKLLVHVNCSERRAPLFALSDWLSHFTTL